jgi:hypothetical protein
VQVIATVLSINPEVDSDIPAMLGASAAVTLAGLPFDGPIGAARVGYIDGQYILNPTEDPSSKSPRLNLVVAGTEQAVLMVESEAHELPEDVMLGARGLRPQRDEARDPGDQRARRRRAARTTGTGKPRSPTRRSSTRSRRSPRTTSTRRIA